MQLKNIYFHKNLTRVRKEVTQSRVGVGITRAKFRMWREKRKKWKNCRRYSYWTWQGSEQGYLFFFSFWTEVGKWIIRQFFRLGSKAKFKNFFNFFLKKRKKPRPKLHIDKLLILGSLEISIHFLHIIHSKHFNLINDKWI